MTKHRTHRAGAGRREGKSLFGGFARHLSLLLLKLWKLKDDCPVKRFCGFFF